MMEEMEEIRKSGVCNMMDRVCVCDELQYKYDICVNKEEYPEVLKNFLMRCVEGRIFLDRME